MSDLLNLFQEPQKSFFLTNLGEIIVHVNFSKKLEIECIFFKCLLAFLTCTRFDMLRQAEEKQKLN